MSQNLLYMNIAYIDAANLDKSVNAAGWKIDRFRLRTWLLDKFQIDRAYMFIGFVDEYRNMYSHLEKAGYELIFKQISYGENGLRKGNCDADLVVQAMTDAYEHGLAKALLVSSDGDYLPLVKKLKARNQIIGILSPAPSDKCSFLLKKANVPMWYLSDQRSQLAFLK